MTKQRQRQYNTPNKWLTNTYSSFVPTKVGDVVKEMALAFSAQNSKYDKAKSNFQTKREGINAINVAPGNQEFFDESIKSYEEQYKKAEERGDFENMVYDAGDIVSKLGVDYKYKKLQSDYLKYSEQAKALEENDKTPENWKAYIKAVNLADNKEGTVDSDGNLVYNKYVDMINLDYMPVADDLKEYTKEMEANGFYEREVVNGRETGKIRLLKDIPGRLGYKKNKILSASDLKEVAMEYLTNSPKHAQSIRNEAEVRIGSMFLNNPNITLEELLPVLNEENPYKPDSNDYKKYIKDRFDYVNAQLEKVKEQKGTKVFNKQKELKNIIVGLKAGDIKENYAETNANLLASYDEDITTWKDENSGNSPNEIVDNVNSSATFYSPVIAESDTQNSSTFITAATKEITDKKEKIKSLEEEIYNAELQNNDGRNEVPDATITKLRTALDKERAEVEYIETKIETSAEAVYEYLIQNGELEEKDFSSYVDEQYNLYLEDEAGDYPVIEKDGGNIASKEEFSFKLKEDIVRAATDPDIMEKGINKIIKNNKEGLSKAIFHRVFDGFKIKYEKNSNKELTFFKEWLNSEAIIKDIAYDYAEELETLSGEPVRDFINNSGIKKEDMEFTLSSTPNFNGDLVGQLSYNKITTNTNKTKNTERKTVTFAFPKGNKKTETVINTVKQSMKNISSSLLPYYNSLNLDKQELIRKANTLINITDGTYERFNKAKLRGTKEGDRIKFPLGSTDYEFLTYNTTNNENHYLVLKEGFTENKAQSGTIEQGKVILGWEKNDITKEGKTIGKPYWVKESEAIKVYDDKHVGFINGFTPEDYGKADDVLQSITLDNALNTGTLNKSATPLEKLKEGSNKWREDTLETSTKEYLNTIDTLIEKYKDVYTIEEGYYPLTVITGSSSYISKNVKTPFIRLNNRGINLMASLFRQVSVESGGELNAVITSGKREKENNASVGGVENSLHLNGRALDILYDKAGKAIIDNIVSNPSLYKGFIVMPSKPGFYHISIPSYLQD